jgi:hypothetical protein
MKQRSNHAKAKSSFKELGEGPYGIFNFVEIPFIKKIKKKKCQDQDEEEECGLSLR